MFVKMRSLLTHSSLTFLVLLLYIHYVISGCSNKGKLGEKPKDLLDLVASQTGYETWIEVVEEGVLTNRIKENYYKDLNEVHVSMFKNWQQTFIDYYPSENVAFVSFQTCKTMTKEKVLRKLYDNFLEDDILLSLFDKQLSAIGMLISLRDNYQARVKKDVDVNTFYYCKEDSQLMEIEVDYNLATNYPVQSRVTITGADKKVRTIRFNFVYFRPITEPHQVSTFPYDKMCKGKLSIKPEEFPSFPGFQKISSNQKYYMELEASMSIRQPSTDLDKVFIDRAKISFNENTLSVQMSSNLSETAEIKVIYNSEYQLKYTINENGKCDLETFNYNSYYDDKVFEHPIKWPFPSVDWPYKFNLLDSRLWFESNENVQYFGQTFINSKKVDIYVRDINSFFSSRKAARAVYFFEVNNQKQRIPLKISLTSFTSNNLQDYSDYNNYFIDLNIVYYTQNPVDNWDAFDVSTCFTESNQYSWFQISFTDSLPNIASLLKADVQIEESFREQLHDYLKIPLIRIPTIRSAFYGSKLFISGKVLERPATSMLYRTTDNYKIKNANQVYFVDSDEECAQLCLNEGRICEFSYCGDLKCELSVNTTLEVIEDDNCKYYYQFVGAMQKPYTIKANKLIALIKEKIKGLFIEVNKKRLFAYDVYRISGPDDVVYDRDDDDDEEQDEDDADSSSSLQLEYKLVNERHKIMDVNALKKIALTRKECLEECENSVNCKSISYCKNSHKECILSGLSETQLKDDNMVFSDLCDIYSRNYISYYSLLPGHSLVKDAIKVIQVDHPEECAKECISVDDFDCQSFDFCSQVLLGTKKRSNCFLHSFHVAVDSNHEIASNVWNLSNVNCNHYSKKFSLDFSEKVSYKFKDENIPVLISDKSMENCASLCIQDSCKSFEFCENPEKPSQTTCRISGLNKINTVNFINTNSGGCSVHLARLNLKKEKKITSSFRLKSAIAMGFFLFILTAITSAIGLLFAKKRFDI